MSKCTNPDCKCEDCRCGDDCQCGRNGNDCCGGQCDCRHTSAHPSHLENMPRLNRISGQLEGVKKMIEDGRYCPDILIQLKAIRSAIRAVESNILSKHLQHCVARMFPEADREDEIKELKSLFDRFEE